MQYSENVSWNRPGWRFSAVPQFDNPDQKLQPKSHAAFILWAPLRVPA
jgi:hypothetical protein